MATLKTDKCNEIHSVQASASQSQSLWGLAKAFCLTAVGKGEEAARHINVKAEAKQESGELVASFDGAPDIQVFVK